MNSSVHASWLPFLVSTLLTAVCCGCGSGIYPVEGKVVWKDGTPATELAGSQVVFELEEANTSARGTVQPDATFRLTTNTPDDGALPGEHKVLVIEAARPMLGGSDMITPGLLDPRYSDPSTSGLTETVKPGINQVTLTVERNKKD